MTARLGLDSMDLMDRDNEVTVMSRIHDPIHKRSFYMCIRLIQISMKAYRCLKQDMIFEEFLLWETTDPYSIHMQGMLFLFSANSCLF